MDYPLNSISFPLLIFYISILLQAEGMIVPFCRISTKAVSGYWYEAPHSVAPEVQI